MKQKIMQVMKERDDSQPLTDTIQLDDAYWGSEKRGGLRGVAQKTKRHLLLPYPSVKKVFPLQ